MIFRLKNKIENKNWIIWIIKKAINIINKWLIIYNYFVSFINKRKIKEVKIKKNKKKKGKI